MKTFETIYTHYFEQNWSFFQHFLPGPDTIDLPDNQYYRIPVYKGTSTVLLMLWNPGARTAIHDHQNGRGMVKVLKGKVREEYFQFHEGELKLLSDNVYVPGQILPVAADRIHSISNAQREFSVTLHVYETPSECLEGVSLYDPQLRRVGLLNNHAVRASWKEKPEAFSNVRSFDQSDL
ncbi:MAG: cysteine dioxygenase family protein [Bacteroidetes bacterium]|nr:cysteine dioxygenase family protein [Bacteroidota bacterium]